MVYVLAFLYTLLQLLLTPFIACYLLVRYRGRKDLLSLIKGKFIRPFLKLPKREKKRLWVHAVSVGEVVACKGIVEELQKIASVDVVISASTMTGLKQAKKLFPLASVHFLLPIDYLWNAFSLFASIRPSLFLLGESDFWINLLVSARFFGVPTALLNGKISARSARRYQRFSLFSRPLFSLVDHYFVQDALQAERFLSFVQPEKITISGNSKLAVDPENPPSVWREECKKKNWWQEGEYIIVVGSTHEGEEKILLRLLQLRKEKIPLRLVFAPRHPERFSKVKLWLQEEKIPFVATSTGDLANKDTYVVVVDQMGVLGFWYSLAHLAVIGGTFTKKVGGHNLIEPHYFDTPCLYGPHVFSQPHLDFLVKQYRSGLQVEEEQLLATVTELYHYPEKREMLCKGAKRLIAAHRGVCIEVAEQIVKKYGNALALNSADC